MLYRQLAIDGNTAYVAEGGPGGVVEVVALDTGTVKGAFPAGHTPMSPVVRNGKLYVAARFDSKIVEMDASSGKVLNSWPASREPVALAVSPDGKKIWAANHLPAGAANGDFTAAALTLVENGKAVHFPPWPTERRACGAWPSARTAATWPWRTC